jgi:uncharacterized membrane protein
VAKLIRQFTCRASEPFWNLSVDNSNARFVSLSGSGEPQAVVLVGKLGITGEGRTPDVDWRGKSDTGASYRALINETQCVDSAADKDAQTQYDYRVQITMPGGKVLRGCCNAGLDTEGPQPAAAVDDLPVADLKSKASDDWTRLLPDLLPGMQACLDKTPGPSAYVTKAWPMNRGMVGTRTRNRDGGWFEWSRNPIDNPTRSPASAILALRSSYPIGVSRCAVRPGCQGRSGVSARQMWSPESVMIISLCSAY